MKLSDAIRRVIELATAMREYWDRELPKRHKDYPWIRAGEDSGPPPAAEEELRRFLRSLPPEDIYRIMTVMYLGRGDFNVHGVFVMPDELKKSFPDVDSAIEFVIAKGPLVDYLSDGLSELEAAKIDIDSLPLVAA